MYKIPVVAITVFLMLATLVIAHSIDIKQTSGPSAGAIKFGMGFSRNNPDIIYVDRYKSTDSGNTWTEFNLPEGAVNNIAVDPNNSNIIYLAAENDMYKSDNGASSWQNLRTLGSDGSVISSLSIDPSNTNLIYAGTTHGKLYKSTDAGKTWDDVSDKLSVSSPVSRISFNQKNPKEIYISTGSWYWSSLVSRPNTGEGLFKSADGGSTFVNLENEFSKYLVQDVDVVGNTVYVTAHNNPDTPVPNQFYAVYKSTDGGTTWKKLLDKSTSFFLFDALTHVAVNPNDENHVIVSISVGRNPEGEGEVVFILSYDGGKTWKLITTKESEPIQYTHELEILGDGRAYAMDYYRPFMKSEDNGETWKWSSQGIRRSRVHSLEIHPTNRNVVFAGTTDGALHKSYDGGETWERDTTKLSSYISSIAFHPEDSNSFYFGVSGPSDATTGRYFGAPGYDTGLYLTQDSGKTFVKFINLEHPYGDEGTQLEIYDVLVHSTNPNLILVGTSSEGIYRSEDRGKTWKESNSGIPQDRFYWNLNLNREGNTPIDRDMCDEVYERYKKGDRITSGCFYYATRTSMNLFVNPHDENEIWYTTLNGIFVSRDLGNMWSWLSDDLKNIHTHFMAFDPSDAKTIYVGTHQGAIDGNGNVIDSSKGLLISRDGGKTWNQVTGGPGEGRDIRAIAVNPKDTDFVAVGTDGPFYVSEDRGKTWEKVELDESVEGIDEIRIDNTSKIIYLGTRTSGVWRGILDYSSSDPAIAEITGVSSPTSVKRGEVFEVIVSVDNVGGRSASIPIELQVGDFKSTRELSILPTSQSQAKIFVMLDEVGTYDIFVNGINFGKISVVEEVKEQSMEKPKEQIEIIEPKETETPPEENKTEEQPRKNLFEMIIEYITSFFKSLLGSDQHKGNATNEG